jgi:hypothetical protein
MPFSFPTNIYHYHDLNIDTIFPTITVGGRIYRGMEVPVVTVHNLRVFENMLLSGEISYICFSHFTKLWYSTNSSDPSFLNFESNIDIIKRYAIAPYDDLKNIFGMSVEEINDSYKRINDIYKQSFDLTMQRMKHEMANIVKDVRLNVLWDKIINSIDDTTKHSNLIDLFEYGVYIKSLHSISGIIDFFFDSGDFILSGISTLPLLYNEPTYNLSYLQNVFSNCILAPGSNHW